MLKIGGSTLRPSPVLFSLDIPKATNLNIFYENASYKNGFVLLPLFVGVTAVAQTTFTPFSNTNQPVLGVYGMPGGESLAGSFITGNTAAYLRTISVTADGGSAASGSPDFEVSLLSNASGLPGSTLATLAGNPFPTNVGDMFVYTYTNTSAPLLLAANTTYWVATSTLGKNNINYPGVTLSTNLDPGSLWTFGAGQLMTERVGLLCPAFICNSALQ
ncbi:MAG TPA: choice-of-anchor R domain-containing protein [Verrucomicrobiae bacterium]|nr:choice-of-anchor R domain-containing protein [Verrucomicrobiae bacterium]